MEKSCSILMLALSLALVVSCNGKAGINKSETAETITEIPVEQESTETEMYVEGEDEEFEEYTPFESAPEYYNFIGNVAGLDVHMSLMSDRWGNVNGRYYYDSRGKKNVNTSMKFYGEFDGSKMILTEFFSDKPTGTFEGNWEADLYQGTFTRAKDRKMFDFHLTQVYSDIVPGGGEAFFEDFDDFYFDIPFYNEYNPSQGQTVMQPQPSEEQLRQQREEMWRQNILENAIDFEDMQSEYFNNPIKAEKKYTVGEEILLKIRIDKIEYYSYDDYTYIMSWLGRFTIDAFLYSNDKSFEELDYPQIVWVKAKYNSRHEAWDNKVTYQFTDAQLLLWKKPGLFE